jgi:hypothetical protein
VALGEPGTPVICWAVAGTQPRMIRVRPQKSDAAAFMTRLLDWIATAF